ncbi:MAG TPA: cytochrome C oxidase subunit IV family protein [Planctomycetaceae bacterium]|nr:cytochrome C oxidase subunit IV family protein [Planctomycetaceae bacterium]
MADAHTASHAPPAHGGGHTAHDAHGVNYLLVFIALCGLTLLSVIFDVVDMKGQRVLGVFNGTIVLAFLVLAVATAKALCVMAFFMHLKFERNWKYLLLAPTIILAMGLPLALLPDIGVHYYTTDTPQKSQVAGPRTVDAPEPVPAPGPEVVPHE